MFGKSQVSAFCGGIVDYLTMILLTEIFGVFYVLSIVVGGIVGAIVNFTINRNWTFGVKTQPMKTQLQRFMVVVIGSIFFKSSGTYLLTEIASLDYKFSRIAIDAIVCFGFNYVMQRKWVFAK